MTLPVSRNTTYAPGSQVLSADLNDIQDTIIEIVAGSHPLKRPARPRHINPAKGTLSAGTATITVAGRVTLTAGAAVWVIPLTAEELEQITSVTALVDPAGATPMDIELWRISNLNVVTSLGTDSSSGTALQTLSISGLTELIAATPAAYALAVTAGQTGDILSLVSLITDVP